MLIILNINSVDKINNFSLEEELTMEVEIEVLEEVHY